MPATTLPRRLLGLGAALFVAASPAMLPAAEPAPAVTAVPGRPTLLLSAFDLASVGYAQAEFFLAGTATSYTVAAPTADGKWQARPAATAPFNTRVVVLRPTDPAKFNGTVLVEWLNVTAGQDTPADWMLTHREIIRKGYAYVAVSAQQVGVEGGNAVMAQGVPLKKANPARYGALAHPGDAFAFDIFSQAGAAVKAAGANGLLGGLKPARVIAIGESQSAAFLTTYVNAVDPVAKVYDGAFVHSRFGSAAALDGTRMDTASAVPAHVRFRPDLRVPVLSLITETDLLGARVSGYHASRTADGPRLRVWEVPGSAHADNYMFGGSFVDSGLKPAADLARIFAPSRSAAMGLQDKTVNPGMPHHYVGQAALAALDGWVRGGRAPAAFRPIQLATGGKEGVKPSLRRDADGLALGGVRTPWVDVPTIRLTGEKNSDNFLGLLVGTGEPLDAAALARLYPGGKAEYLKRFTASLDAAIARGAVLKDDRAEILAVAALNYPAS